MNPTGTNDLVITIGGDLSGFEEALAQIPQLAQQAFGQVQAAIAGIDFSGAGGGASDATDGLQALGAAAQQIDTDLQGVAATASASDDALASTAGASEALASGLADLADDATSVATDMSEIGSAAADAGEGLAASATDAADLADSIAALSDAASDTGDGLETIADSAGDASAGMATLADSASGVDDSVSSVADAAEAAATAGDDLTEALGNVDGAASEVASEASTMSDSVEGASESLNEAGQSAESASESFSEMGEQLVAIGEGIAGFEVLKDLGSDAITAAGNIQTATVSLQALGMSSEQASQTIENLEALAVNDALSMPDLLLAQQRMTALQVPLAQIPTLITDAAGAAATMNVSFSRVVQQIDNMVSSGTVSVSTLARMGVSAQSFVAAMNQVGGQGTADVNNLSTAFAGLSKGQAIQVVELAMQSLGNSVAAQAATIPGQLKIIQTSFDILLEDIGNNIAPATSGVVQGVQALLSGFMKLPGPIKEVTEDLLAISVATIAAAAAFGGISAAIGTTFGAATIGAIATVGTAISGLVVDTVAYVTGASGAVAATLSFGAAAATLAVGIGALIGWKLGPVVSDWVTSLLGFGTAAEAAAANAKDAAGGTEQLATSATGGTGATGTFAAALNTLGVSLADVPQKSKDATTAIQSFAQSAVTAATAAANVGAANQNAAQTFSATAQLYASGQAGLTQYTTALDTMNKSQMAANNGLEAAGTAALLAVNAYQNLVVSASNAVTTFSAVATAYASGQATLSQYTTALAAMNKAQIDANNGIESAGTAALLAANDYVNIAAKATNAATTVSALGQAAADGTVSWTQYDTALKQLVTDEENANNGFISTATSLAVVQEAFQNLGVAEANAQTNLETATAAFNSGSASLSQYTAALQAAYKAQMDLNNGVASFPLQMSMAENAWQNAAAAANNAAIKAQAYYAALQAGYPVLQQTITAVGDAGAAMEKAAGGVVTWQSALLSLQSSQEQVNLNLQNANTTLGQAQQMYANGSITIGVYNKALQAQQAALAAVQGAAKTATSSTQGLAAAQSGLSSSLSTVGGAANQAAAYWENLNGTMQAVQTTYQMVNGTLVVGTNNLTANADAAQQVVTTTQNLNGTMVTTSTNLTQLAGAANQAATSFQNLNGTLVVSSTDLKNVASGASSAASGVSSVGTAAAGAATQVKSLGQELDAAFGDIPGKSLGESLDASMGATPGNLNMSLSANQTYNEPTGLVSGIGDTELIQDPTWLNTYGGPNATANVNPLPNTPSIYDSTSAITAVTKGAQSATTAVAALATSASSAATATAALATTTESVTQAQSTLNTDYQSYIQTGQGLAQVLSDFQTLQEANNEAMGGTTTALNNLATGATDATTALSGSGGVSDSLNSVAQGATLVTQTFDGAAGAITGAIVPSLNALNDGFTPLTTSLEGLSSASINASNYVDTFYQAVNSATPPMLATTQNLGQLATSLNDMLPVIGQVTKALNQVNTVQGGVATNAGTITYASTPLNNPDIAGGTTPDIGTYNSLLANAQNVNYGGGAFSNPLYSGPDFSVSNAPGVGGVGGGSTGADALSAVNTVPAGSTLTLTVSAGTVVGQGGMQQLTTLIGQQLVQMLAAKGIRLNRQ